MRALILAACLLFFIPLFAQEPAKEIDRDTLSEALGHLIVQHLGSPGFDFNIDKVMKGMEEARKGNASPLTEDEYEQAIYALQQKSFADAAEKNLSEAAAFLKENARKKGVKILNDQIQYKILKKGKGKRVKPQSTPLVHYQGKFIDGTVFSGSVEGDDPTPVPLPMAETIPGVVEGVVGMHEGEKRVLYIHPEMAFGTSGFLPPNSLLIFEVEVVKAQAPADPADIAQKD